MPTKSEYIRSKSFENKRKLPFMIYADFKSILVPEDDGIQNPDKSRTNKYQNHHAFSYCYKTLCVDDKFSKRCKSYLDKDAAFVSSVVSLKKARTKLVF